MNEIKGVVQPLFSDRPVIKESVYELKRRCGKPRCKCARGELHARMVISASEGGKTRLQVIPRGFVVEVQDKVRGHQELRRVRARLGTIYRKMLKVIDQMEAMRRRSCLDRVRNGLERRVGMELVIFEEDKPFILEDLRDGELDYIEAASEVIEADFFRFIKARAYLDSLTETYPMPMKKGEVPFWFYGTSNLSMRLHGVPAFDAFSMVVRCGGMLQAFGPKAGRSMMRNPRPP